MKLSKNNSSINSLKGLGILAVVYAHNYNGIISEYIYTFHMPLFFFISGFLEISTKYEFNEYLSKKFKRLIIPYFIYATVLFLFWFFIGRKFGNSVESNLSPLKNFIGIFYSQGGPEYMDWGIPMWFLPALFLTTIISYHILKFKTKYQVLIISIFGFISWYYSSQFHFMLPWSINIVLSSIIFFFVGHWIREIHNIIQLNSFHLILLVISFFLLHFIGFRLNSPINMYYGQYGNYFLFLINGITGSIWLLSASLLLTKRITIIDWLGKNSLLIMILHLRAMTILKAIAIYLLGIELKFTPLNSLFYSIIQIIILVIPIIIINKYFKWTLGILPENTQFFNKILRRNTRNI